MSSGSEESWKRNKIFYVAAVKSKECKDKKDCRHIKYLEAKLGLAIAELEAIQRGIKQFCLMVFKRKKK